MILHSLWKVTCVAGIEVLVSLRPKNIDVVISCHEIISRGELRFSIRGTERTICLDIRLPSNFLAGGILGVMNAIWKADAKNSAWQKRGN